MNNYLPLTKKFHIFFYRLIRLILFLNLFCILNDLSTAQTLTQTIDSSKANKILTTYESSLKLKADSTIGDSSQHLFKMSKSTTGAIWRSLVLPGWGQVYAESYWKAPLFTAGAATIGYFIFWNDTRYRKYNKEYQDSMTISPGSIGTLRAKIFRDYYWDNRDQLYFYLAAVYVIAAIDAYVDVHLYDFNVKDVVSLGLSPRFDGGVYLRLTLKR